MNLQGLGRKISKTTERALAAGSGGPSGGLTGGDAAALAESLAAFVDGLAVYIDGRPPAPRPAPAPLSFDRDELLALSKLVGIETRALDEPRPVVFSAPPPSAGLIAALEARVIAAAAKDFNVFAEYVATDEETGRPIVQAPLHRRWAELAAKHKRLLIWSHIESAKTTQLSVLRTVWELGRNPRLRYLILSNTTGQAAKIVKSIKAFILKDLVRKVFPSLEPHPEGPWSGHELRIVGNDGTAPSVRASGIHGNITGTRTDRLIIDDILDLEVTNSPANRKALDEWVKATAFSRLTKNARVLVVGTAFHPFDFLHQLEADGVYSAYRFPIIDPLTGEITWPEAWSKDRISEKQRELGPVEFARNMLCQARNDSTSSFKEADINEAVRRGNGFERIHSLADFPDGVVPEGSQIFVGVDPSFSRKKGSDDTAISTILVDSKGMHTLIDLIIVNGKTGAEICDLVWDLNIRYEPVVVAVENNAAQTLLAQQLRARGNIPVREFTTTAAKRDPITGIESVANLFHNQQVTIPSANGKLSPTFEKFRSDLLFYSKSAHTPDTLMSFWFAATQARRVMGGGNRVVARVLDGTGGFRAEAEARARERARAEAEARLRPEVNPRRKAHEAIDLTGRPDDGRRDDGRPDAARYPDSVLHCAFDVQDDDAAPDEWTARERERNARHAGGHRDEDGSVVNVGHWSRGGWTGGGVLR